MADDFFTFLSKVQTQYPQAMSILSQPGVMEVYRQAIDGGWSPERLQSALYATPWWTQTSAPQRQWQALAATDPSTAGDKVEQTKRIIMDLQAELGVLLDGRGGFGSPANAFLFDAVRNNWDATEIRYRMIASVNSHYGDGVGLVGTYAAQAKKMGNDYGVPMSDASALNWGRRMAMGQMDEGGMRGYLIEQAKSLFPSLGDYLDQGGTVMDYVNPYIQIAQQEVGLNPADVNLTDSKWMNVLNQVDPKTGQRVAMSLDQALRTIRTDSAWGYDSSSSGMASATDLASKLQSKFGAAA